MRAYVALRALISQDADQLQQVLDTQWAFDDASATAALYQSGTYVLTPSQSGFQVPFGGVTQASTIIIISAGEIFVQLGAVDAPSIPLRPFPAVAPDSVLSYLQQFDQPAMLCWTGKVTSIYLTNPSTTASASVFVALLGDAV